MTTRNDHSDWWTLAIVCLLALVAALVFVPGCSQPPEADAPPAPVSVTAPIGEALGDVDAIPPLGESIKTDAQRLTPANVPTLAPRIERNADEVIDHARAASAKLSETQATSRANDKRVADLQAAIGKLEAANAKLAEQVQRERTSAMRRVQFIAGGLGTFAIIGGVGLAFVMPKSGIIAAIGGVLCVSVATLLPTLADWAPVIVVVSTLIGVGLLAHRLGWFDATLRRVVQAVEVTGKQAFATVKDVKANIALTTDDGFHAIVRDETRPAGK